MNFKFSFGKKSKAITQWAIISVVLTSLITLLHQCSGVSEDKIWDLVDKIQREAIKNKVKVPEELNDYIIKTPHLLERRIKRDVDRAIQDYDSKVRSVYEPTYIEEDNDESLCYSENCKKLAPPMRICSSFVEGIDCPRKKEDE